ncbi:MAG TPA: PAAR domain-containing protein [Thermoanaerobaculia bacterium]|nr:PAAR domain-containing protein [Thermoanaerobaculia bacterium]
MAMAARLGDMHNCPLTNPDGSPHTGGPIQTSEGSVLIEYMPAARLGDLATCVGASDAISTGDATCLIGYMPAARVGDATAHGGVIVAGGTSVLIGG